ncbi:MAG: hypothetical protein ACI8ZO_000574 [Flavobacteriales bacterium]|jgi:hypothetical protein
MKTRNLISTIILSIITQASQAQSWKQSNACHKNVYAQAIPNQDKIIDATIKIIMGSECTGVLLNRDVHQNDLGDYMLTAWHCLKGEDFNSEVSLLFHYQSPDRNTNSTPEDNHGASNTIETSRPGIDNLYRFVHKTKLQLIEKKAYGDLALVKILTPIPKQWNVAYAGWLPAQQILGVRVGQSYNIHHPKGDIKKINNTQVLK